VRTTGIYCLPACPAKKARRENVDFFPTCEAARAAGFRACLKCHPDDFAAGADPVLESIEALVAEIRTEPGKFRDTKAVVRRSGFGATRVFELFRLHYHCTPADLLTRARLATARQRLVSTSTGLAGIAAEVGFESLSVFHEQFRRHHGLTPAVYRGLKSESGFKITLPADYPLPYLRRALGRDSQSVSERLEGDTYTAAVQLSTGPSLLTLTLKPKAIAARVSSGSVPEAHAVVAGLVGLEQDAAGLVRLTRRLGLARLASRRAGLRLSQTPNLFDGLLWAVIGQQVNLAFACTLRRRLIELAGTPVGAGLIAPPTPAAVAALDPAALRPLQFSRQKAAVIVHLARLSTEGGLDLAALTGMSATRAERTLLALHGLGPWSVNYVMMRSLGFADCVPYGDTGVTSGLQALLRLEERPDVDATKRLMAVFSPYRSLATAQLWQFNKPIPR
jgi:AraC family transcriptional regulator of adaptative response / DNA-3-methyladenine glycosylase II